MTDNITIGFFAEQQSVSGQGSLYQARGNQPVMYVFYPPDDYVIKSAQAEKTTTVVSRPIIINPSDAAIGNCMCTIHELSNSMVPAASMASGLTGATGMAGSSAAYNLFSINGEAAAALPQFDTAGNWDRPSFLLMIPSTSSNVGAMMITAPTYSIVSGVCSDWPFDPRTNTINPNCLLIIGAGNYVTQGAMSHNPIVTGFVRSRNDMISSTAPAAPLLYDATPNSNVGNLMFEMAPALGGDYNPGSFMAVAHLNNSSALNVSESPVVNNSDALNTTGSNMVDFNVKLADPVNNAVATMDTILHGIDRAMSPAIGSGPYDELQVSDQITNVIRSQINTNTKTTNHGAGLLDSMGLVSSSVLTMGQLIGKFGDVNVIPIKQPKSNLGGSNLYDNISTIMGQMANPIIGRIMLEKQIASCTFTYQSRTHTLALDNASTFSSPLTIDQIRLKAAQIANAIKQEFAPLALGMGHKDFILSGSYSASFGITTMFKSLDSSDIPDPRGIHSPLFMGIVGAGTLLANKQHTQANVAAAANIFQALSTGMINNSPVMSAPVVQYAHPTSALF